MAGPTPMQLLLWIDAGWVSFVALCVLLPMAWSHCRRRANARAAAENFALARARLAEMERGDARRDWESLEQLLELVPMRGMDRADADAETDGGNHHQAYYWPIEFARDLLVRAKRANRGADRGRRRECARRFVSLLRGATMKVTERDLIERGDGAGGDGDGAPAREGDDEGAKPGLDDSCSTHPIGSWDDSFDRPCRDGSFDDSGVEGDLEMGGAAGVCVEDNSVFENEGGDDAEQGLESDIEAGDGKRKGNEGDCIEPDEADARPSLENSDNGINAQPRAQQIGRSDDGSDDRSRNGSFDDGLEGDLETGGAAGDREGEGDPRVEDEGDDEGGADAAADHEPRGSDVEAGCGRKRPEVDAPGTMPSTSDSGAGASAAWLHADDERGADAAVENEPSSLDVEAGDGRRLSELESGADAVLENVPSSFDIVPGDADDPTCKTSSEKSKNATVESGGVSTADASTSSLDEADDDSDDRYVALRLPCASPTTKTSRLVPATCAICLGPYAPGDLASWSSNGECAHAFHRDCVLLWMLKKGRPECPCCRGAFVLDADGKGFAESGEQATQRGP